MKKERKDKDFVKSPYFEGGRSALDAFVKNELRYPSEALKAGIEGTVSLRYTVDYKGVIKEVMVISGIGYGCDEEAIRVVRSLHFKVPEDGKIKSKYSRKIHIHFRLPGSTTSPKALKETAPVTMQVQYQVTSSSKPNPTPAKSNTSSYQIRIHLGPPEENKS